MTMVLEPFVVSDEEGELEEVLAMNFRQALAFAAGRMEQCSEMREFLKDGLDVVIRNKMTGEEKKARLRAVESFDVFGDLNNAVTNIKKGR